MSSDPRQSESSRPAFSVRSAAFVVAGHAGHGKTALVRALTGAPEAAPRTTTRLRCSFASLPGLDATLIDAPGHASLTRVMIAGAAAADAAVLAVAADGGVQPQTIEHLNALARMGVAAGVVVITKCDLAPPERVAETRARAADLVKGTFLESAAVVDVSAMERRGLGELADAMGRAAQAAPARFQEAPFRLFVDRVFTVRGVGLVATGVVRSGALQTGQRMTCYPAGLACRARGLHVNDQTADSARAGQRAAIHIEGAAKGRITAGDTLAAPESLRPAFLVEMEANRIEDAVGTLAPGARVRLHHGGREVLARVLTPGQEGRTRLLLDSPIAAVAGDAVVIRSFWPTRVSGGGRIVSVGPQRDGAPLLAAVDAAGARGLALTRIEKTFGVEGVEALRAFLDSGVLAKGEAGAVFSSRAVEDMAGRLLARAVELHSLAPQLASFALDDLAAAFGADEGECAGVALAVLVERGELAVKRSKARLASHRPVWTGPLAEARQAILRTFGEAGLSTPTVEQLAEALGMERDETRRALSAMTDAGELTRLAPDIYVLPPAVSAARQAVLDFLRVHRAMTVAQARELLGASRKYLLPLLEGMDRAGLTRREGDGRTLRSS
ncbi:MAG TPA: SelB C-terminal domain-containing protein [Candidatus Brocadiia bacterium]|nr:SelB C-terminal domain-containing protein [Candidatus Brocadiia bacterium]